MTSKAGPWKKQSHELGFSLIEIIITIVIVATMMGLAVSFFGHSTTQELRSLSGQLMGIIRYAYNEAAITKRTYRLVFDMAEKQYWLEAVEGDFVLKKDAEQKEEEAKVGSEKEESGEEAQPPPEFGADEEGTIKKVKLKEGIKIRGVYVAHQEGMFTEGRAYLYFFPRGLTEKAVIYFSDEDEENTYSIVVNPISAQCKILTEFVEYSEAP